MSAAVRRAARAALGIAAFAMSATIVMCALPARAQAPASDDSAAGVASDDSAAGVASDDSAASDVHEQFARATERMAAGEHRQAAEAFVALADGAPHSAVAGDALFTAAKLYEERLLEPARALELYGRLLDRYPQSRVALAAGRRAETLAELLGAGPIEPAATPHAADGAANGAAVGAGHVIDSDAVAALSRFTDILQNFPQRTESESLAMAETLVAEHPGWSGLPRVLLWMAGVHQRAGRLDRALALYEQAARAAPAGDDHSDNLFAAYRGAGDVALARGDHDAAERYFQKLPIDGDPGRARGRDDALAELARERHRARLHDLAFITLLVIALVLVASLRHAAGSWPRALRALRAPPTEVIFMAPIVVILIAASLASHYAIGPAVIIICAGGLALTWLSGAGLRAGGGLMRARAAVHAGAVVIAVIALCYLAIHHNRLIDMVLDTVRFGPDL